MIRHHGDFNLSRKRLADDDLAFVSNGAARLAGHPVDDCAWNRYGGIDDATDSAADALARAAPLFNDGRLRKVQKTSAVAATTCDSFMKVSPLMSCLLMSMSR